MTESSLAALALRYPRLFKCEVFDAASFVPLAWQGLLDNLFLQIDRLLSETQAKDFHVLHVGVRQNKLRIDFMLFGTGTRQVGTAICELVWAAERESEGLLLECGQEGVPPAPSSSASSLP